LDNIPNQLSVHDDHEGTSHVGIAQYSLQELITEELRCASSAATDLEKQWGEPSGGLKQVIFWVELPAVCIDLIFRNSDMALPASCYFCEATDFEFRTRIVATN